MSNNYKLLIKLFKKQPGGLDKTEFCDMLTVFGLGGEKGLGEKLF